MIKQGNIASEYINELTVYLEQLGVAHSTIYAGVSIETIKDIKSCSGKVDLNSYKKIIGNIPSEISITKLAFELAQRSSITAHGYLGLAILCGLNLKSVLNLVVRFYRTRSNLLDINMLIQKNWVTLSTTPTVDLGVAEKFTIEITLAVLHTCKKQLLNDSGADDILSLTQHDSSDASIYAENFSGHVNLNANENSLRFPAGQLGSKIKTANATTSQTIELQLEQELSTIEMPNLLRAIEEVFNCCAILPNAQQTAQQLFISERTMRRQLAQLGTNFQAILEKYRSKKACELLTESDISIINLANKLGFTDSSNFSKAFKRSTGMSPNAYRKQHKL